MSVRTVLGSTRGWAALVASALAMGALMAVVQSPAAHADTSPAAGSGLPATVSADALPTVQQNGVVWSEATVGNTVYATGSFTETWPAGSTNSAATDTARSNLLAFDITTGNLIGSFNHVLNAQGLVVTASPDGSRVYVGGDFTTVDGVTHNHIVAFDTATGAVDPTFKAGLGAEVGAIAATNSTVYVGGDFLSANGVARTRLAAFTTATGALTSWAPTADDRAVSAMVVAPDGSRVIIGGHFSTINGASVYGLGAVDATTGASLPFAANQSIRDYGSQADITQLTTDGTQVYVSGYSYIAAGGVFGNFEGTAGVNPDTGAINFLDDCHGDTYGTYPMNSVLYSVSHAHDCSAIGAFPDTTTPRYNHHALAETTTPSANTNVSPDSYGWTYAGIPTSTLLQWYPTLGEGTYTGQTQAAWSITGNGSYIALGGEFPTANGVAQQGLVRFAVTSIAPNKVGPVYNATSLTPQVVSLAAGTAKLTWTSTWDYDNQYLTYKVFRDNSNTPIYTTTVASNFWTLPTQTFTDTGLTPGSTHTYRVRVYDPFGNTTNGSATSVTISSTVLSQYAKDVLADGAANYWRLDEASGTTAYDWAGNSNLTETSSGIAHSVTGAINGDSDTATGFTGGGASGTGTAVAGPNTYSIEAWFDTTSTSGGLIAGFGTGAAGTASGGYDRNVFIDNGGHVNYGVNNGTPRVLTSAKTYNDGQWHYVVATLSPAGMTLSIDGATIATNPAVTTGQPYNGYWHIGSDTLKYWPNQPSSNSLTGSIDDVAIYPTALSATQIAQHYVDSGRTSSIPTDTYGKTVYGDGPSLYWRLDDASGPTAADASSNGTTGTYHGGVSYLTPSTVTPSGTGITLDGSSGFLTATQPSTSPDTFTEELWFKTTTTSGGDLINFGDSATGSSNANDRQLEMNNAGQIDFYVWPHTAVHLTSTASYNNGDWHQVIATVSNTGSTLYVDGTQVAANTSVTASSLYNFTGYWHVGYDKASINLASSYFAGSLDEVAVYPYALSAAQVRTHYRASSAALNIPPVASFTQSCGALTCSVNAAGSYDPDGSVVSYSWNFGDGTTATGATASHVYASPGSYQITLTVTDDQGATGQSSSTVTVQAPPSDAYGQAVIADNPTLYWRLNEASGPTAADATTNGNNGAYSGGVTYQTPSAVTAGTGVTLDGSTGQIATTQAVTAPTVYSEELWFKTTTTSGGTLIAFGDQPSGLSSNHDRQVYLLNSGQLVFGVWTGQNNTVTSAKSYNDGQWHQVVATQGPDGMTLYVDGQAVGTNPTTQAQPFTGYWRVGGENLLGWPGPASSNYVAASIDEVAVYTSELSAARVAAHFAAGGTVNIPPVAAFTPSCTNLVCSFDGTASHDPDGTVASYAWSFGDGATATGSTASHTYAAGGSYTATLTVTDNQGASTSVSQLVTVVANVAPVAAFTPSCTNLVCSFDGTASHDPDGTVASYAWSFGDGSTATGATAGHTFAAAGDFSVTLTVTDNGGATGTVTQVVSPRPVANPSAAPIASDAFGRTLASGLGDADLGGAWSSNGSASVLSVTPGKAAITMSKPGVTAGAYLGALSSTSTDTTVTLTTDKAPTGGGIYLAVVGRRLSSTLDYRTRLRLLSNGTVGVSLLSENAGTETLLAGEKILSGITYTPGMQFSVELQVTGTNPTTLRVKVWQTGQAVPSAWLLSATDSTAVLQVPGAVGLVGYLSGSSTTSPVSMLASSFSVAPLVAAPTAAATANCSGLVCTVSAAGSTDPSGSITNYQWEWADGILTTGVSSSHTYSRAGTYRVTLTVTDPSGLTSVTTLTVTVPA